MTTLDLLDPDQTGVILHPAAVPAAEPKRPFIYRGHHRMAEPDHVGRRAAIITLAGLLLAGLLAGLGMTTGRDTTVAPPAWVRPIPAPVGPALPAGEALRLAEVTR